MDQPRMNRPTRRQVITAACATGLAGLAGCAGEESVGGGSTIAELTITQSVFPPTPDPTAHCDTSYFSVFDHIYEPLFVMSPDTGPKPAVVTNWEHDEGAIALELRNDVVFHDQRNLTAEDVVFTIERQLEMEHAAPQRAGLGPITGAETIDKHSLHVAYDSSPTVAELALGTSLRVVNRDWYESDAFVFHDQILGSGPAAFNGTGPYEVVAYDPTEQSITMERFPQYWGEVTAVNRVTFRARRSDIGRVNALNSDRTQLIDNVRPENISNIEDRDEIGETGKRVVTVSPPRSMFLVMKNKFPPFDSRDFRLAMNYAVDVEDIVEDLLLEYAEPIGQPVPPGVTGYDPELDPYPHDPDTAQQLVADSGYADDGGVEITLYGSEDRYLHDNVITRRITQHINRLSNVHCRHSVEPYETIRQTTMAGFADDSIAFFLRGWNVATGDTDYGVSGFFVEDAPLQNFQDNELSDAILETRHVTDPKEREEALQAVNRLSREKVPWVFLYQQDHLYGINPSLRWEPRRDERISANDITAD